MSCARLRHNRIRIIGEVLRQLGPSSEVRRVGLPYSLRELRDAATDELIDLYVRDVRLAGCSNRRERMSYASREFMARHPGYSPIQIHKQLEMVAFV